MEFSILEIFLIVFSQMVLLFLYNLFIRQDERKHDVFQDKLELLNSIFLHTKHSKIISLEEIKQIELQAQKVNVFSQDIYRDVKDNGQFANDTYNIGTFYETVQTNLKSGKEYNYFLKKDANHRHSIVSFFKSHPHYEKVEFVIIPSEKYYFYDEVYLYEFNDGTFKGYEFLPSISNETEERLYYLELDDKQVKRLFDIKVNLSEKYQVASHNEVLRIQANLDEFSSI